MADNDASVLGALVPGSVRMVTAAIKRGSISAREGVADAFIKPTHQLAETAGVLSDAFGERLLPRADQHQWHCSSSPDYATIRVSRRQEWSRAL
jgi:hypothetical protein